MITLCSADRAPDTAVLRSLGGFSWFYVDLLEDEHRAATVIWSWGLPFLPGYAGAARAGRPQTPIERPSVNVVVYERGAESFYLLSELAPDQCEWSPDGRSWRMGESTFTWIDTPSLSGDAPVRELRANLDLALPTGGRATGKLWLSGPLRRDPVGHRADAGGEPTHSWTPMVAACHGGLDLQTPRGHLRVEGRGYHDRNSAARPLQELGIQSWWWGRLALPGRDLIFYRLLPSRAGSAPRDLVVELGADGSCRIRDDAQLRVGRLRRSTWGLRWPESIDFTDPDGRPVRADVVALLDNGPFYQRYLLRGRCEKDAGGAEEGYGMGEHLVPGRVDGGLLRPLVKMRVHRTAGPNSMWLPLFSEDTDGRVRRLLANLARTRARSRGQSRV